LRTLAARRGVAFPEAFRRFGLGFRLDARDLAGRLVPLRAAVLAFIVDRADRAGRRGVRDARFALFAMVERPFGTLTILR
jgi:hypothetical protein